jgi:hypothetical protein
VTLAGQERAYDETPIMAAAVKYMQRFYGGDVPGFEVPPEHRRTDFRLAAATYDIEPVQYWPGDRGLPRARIPKKSATQNTALLRQLATAVALDTVTAERAVMVCLPFMVPRSGRGSNTYTACRFTQTHGVLGASLPVISGDTAKVEIWAWVNSVHPRYPEHIREELWAVTLVREEGVWRVVRHTHGNPWVG